MDVPPDSGYNRYADTGSSSSTILRYSYPIFLRSTTGRRNIRHTDALQLHVASFYRDFTLRFGHLARSYIGNDVDRHLYSVTDGTYLLFRLHERRSRFSTLLRFPIPVYHVYAGIGRCNQHLPDVPFWELVGVSSYLLIGFYYTKPAAIAASKKAFIVTRFADLGFLIGILIYGYYGGTFGFTPDTVSLISGGASMLPLALGLMFVGGAGKSAMFPLHIWLPDAMEGPTPVSALIHAATMVVAGVYLVARMFPLFITYAPNTLHMVAWVGAFTAFYAASVACVQSDIKRVLAFSTISQIGFMMVALGVCTSMNPHEGGLGYMASMFHLSHMPCLRHYSSSVQVALSMPYILMKCPLWEVYANICRSLTGHS